MTFLSSFRSSLISSARIWSCPSAFLFQLTYCHLYVYTTWWFVHVLSNLLHCHCLFCLATQSAFHNIQTTFVGHSFCCLLYYLPYLYIVMFVVWILFLYYSLLDKISLLHCYILTYLLTYLLTYSMEQSPSREANWFCS